MVAKQASKLQYFPLCIFCSSPASSCLIAFSFSWFPRYFSLFIKRILQTKTDMNKSSYNVGFDLYSPMRDYVRKMITATQGFKALLLDNETLKVVSMVYSQSELLSNEIFFIDNIENVTKPHKNLSAILFLRPTAENIQAVRNELQQPKFESYKLFFSNIIKRGFIEELAETEGAYHVDEIHEFFGDYYSCGNFLASLNVSPCLNPANATPSGISAINFERALDGILSTCLASMKRPQIRFQKSSPLCKNLAERLSVRMDQESQLFDFRSKENTVLLIIDRREDPVTPLLNQWTYEAMIHEILGIKYNRVSLEKIPGVKEEFKNVVLNAAEDDFYSKNMYLNFGDLGANVKDLVDTFKKNTSYHQNVDSIEDILKFVDDFPEFRKKSANVTKHVTLIGELSRRVEKDALLEISQLEQDIACNDNESEHRKQVLKMISDPRLTQKDKLRLVLLYALRYESCGDSGLVQMKDSLYRHGVGSDQIAYIQAVLNYGGEKQRSGDLFNNKSFFAKASNTVRRGIGGVDNVYTQHEPLLIRTLDNMFRAGLSETEFPYIDGTKNLTGTIPPKNLLIFMAGGVTYEEAKCVAVMNGMLPTSYLSEGSSTQAATLAARGCNANIALIGSCIHNMDTFLHEISTSASLINK